MGRYNIIGFLALLWAAVACERPVPPVSDGEKAAYNLTGYLQQQAQRLQAEKPMVLKSVKTQNKPTETIETSDVDWEKELSIFQEVDLSRPALRDFYQEQQQTLPNGSTITVFLKSEDAAAPVEQLVLTVSPFQKLEHLEAVVLEENILFYSKRKITLTAESGTGNVSGYRVEGVQKLIFGDSLHYRIDANL
ncbi:hypothetical protein H9Q13_09350 [Pontibacter sp. JH31]|uniref:Uncharacterized protein n=1 Tax=Pontibacter aquaedesilientis TaxID=2766980 RepID=A0ABR7XGF0_9BACT|nr:hypothetical protein [Pontibacter aquaedesilientis]